MNMKKIVISLVALIATVSISAIVLNRDSEESGSHRNGMEMADYESQASHFAQMMIPHHEQAIELSEIAISVSTNDKIVELANRIKFEQAPEIKIMKRWVKDDQMTMSDHQMQMSGFASDEEIAALKKLSGKAFDLKFLEIMIAHHEGAIDMAGEINRSRIQKVANLSESIITVQRAEIDEMKTLIDKLA